MLIFGKNPIFEYLKHRPKDIKNIWTADEKIFNKIRSNYKVPIKLTDKKNIEKLLNNNKEAVHQNLAAELKMSNIFNLETVLQKISEQKKDGIILILDHINDPQNFGAIIRTAAFFNTAAIIIAKDRQTPINATVIKAASGMTALLNFAVVVNLNAALETLKNSGYWIYASAAAGGENLENVQINEPIALIVGNEGEGVSRLLVKNSDFKITISGSTNVESLNVSVSTAIMLYHFYNKISK
ncbi:MAG TPA: 23S rRNA (guanosine(2251)-2'-O)-methyltransferase RlmB [bacterium]|nr:23S rRNA (guanosine(2251)-2'-O)-methyltransferase RlmB [bacterium]HPP87727.1 23S rRNA (guanosine(2251)-2'-O)-methyltransferase RlmB [bacterium]